jgi:hypothetical protein
MGKILHEQKQRQDLSEAPCVLEIDILAANRESDEDMLVFLACGIDAIGVPDEESWFINEAVE